VKLNLVYSRRANRDLADLYRYIALDQPDAADRFRREIIAHCEILRDNPQLGVARSDLRKDVRIFSFKRRVAIAYVVTDDTIQILRVFYAGQDFETIIGGA